MQKHFFNQNCCENAKCNNKIKRKKISSTRNAIASYFTILKDSDVHWLECGPICKDLLH